ncbi:hypothetical protein B0H16DRAFT_1465432 [Mycena metata]|uniref:Pali-domain-containing protein n=1 Tax=Mycena metata TaxID=1033252 RepID=A0AAD7ID77_9AGAR|nr:hypothetical protein B0H16DRAFT_1465432 [Mycena metata]
MSRAFYLSGMVFLLLAVILSFLASISLPYLTALDVVRVKFNGNSLFRTGADELREVRWGIWGPCRYDGNLKRTCFHTGHGYAVGPITTDEGESVTIGAAWTRGLAIHPVATGVVAIAAGLAASKWEHGPIAASLTSFLAALILLIAFAIDLALFVFVHHEIGRLDDVQANVHAGAAFWMNLVALILVLLAACTVCFGRRKESGNDAYPMFSKTSGSGGGFLSRFRRN